MDIYIYICIYASLFVALACDSWIVWCTLKSTAGAVGGAGGAATRDLAA